MNFRQDLGTRRVTMDTEGYYVLIKGSVQRHDHPKSACTQPKSFKIGETKIDRIVRSKRQTPCPVGEWTLVRVYILALPAERAQKQCPVHGS